MATEHGTLPTPDSIVIEINQLPRKRSHHCRFENCLNERRGYNDFCREHKAIGKIISGRIARQKAIEKIAARDKSNYATEVASSVLAPVEPTPETTTSLIGEILMIISVPLLAFYFYVYLPLAGLAAILGT